MTNYNLQVNVLNKCLLNYRKVVIEQHEKQSMAENVSSGMTFRYGSLKVYKQPIFNTTVCCLQEWSVKREPWASLLTHGVSDERTS